MKQIKIVTKSGKVLFEGEVKDFKKELIHLYNMNLGGTILPVYDDDKMNIKFTDCEDIFYSYKVVRVDSDNTKEFEVV